MSTLSFLALLVTSLPAFGRQPRRLRRACGWPFRPARRQGRSSPCRPYGRPCSLNPFEPLGTPWNPLEPLGTPGTPWNPLEPLGTLWNPLEPLGTLWNPLEPLGTKLDEFGRLCATLDDLFWPHLVTPFLSFHPSPIQSKSTLLNSLHTVVLRKIDFWLFLTVFGYFW